MKRSTKILCLILALLILAIGGVLFWQRDNLKALYLAKTLEADAILQAASEQSELRQKELEEYGVTLRTPTQDELDTLLNGGSLPEEEPPTPDEDEVRDIIQRCIQELYDCEIALMARLAVMKQAAVDEWKALPEEERTKEKKLEIGYRGLDACYDLEVEIDAQVKGILDKYRQELKNIGASTAPMKTLWKHYCEEKASTKAYYLNKYL